MGTVVAIANVAVLNEIKKVVNVSKRPKDRYKEFGAKKKKKQRDYRLKRRDEKKR